jgi:hypothetical protein
MIRSVLLETAASSSVGAASALARRANDARIVSREISSSDGAVSDGRECMVRGLFVPMAAATTTLRMNVSREEV